MPIGKRCAQGKTDGRRQTISRTYRHYLNLLEKKQKNRMAADKAGWPQRVAQCTRRPDASMPLITTKALSPALPKRK